MKPLFTILGCYLKNRRDPIPELGSAEGSTRQPARIKTERVPDFSSQSPELDVFSFSEQPTHVPLISSIAVEANSVFTIAKL